jgi:hypothetical protein
VIEFDLEYTLDLSDPDGWVTADRTTNHLSTIPVPGPTYFIRVGAHYK